MSKQVDERVVSMQFDNANFEKNVSTTMSTLDKLKAKLKLDNVGKGFDNINKSVKNVDMTTLSASVGTVSSKFSALEVMGITALANITNSAVNAGKRMLASFTIDPVKTGFQEYELKMGSVQTIMASTGASLEEVNGYLSELNEYSDKTIYSFSDMTNNIGKFTNAGVKLDKAVLAIKGVSNEAAVSGANANEASRAMYNFAQALSAGYVKLIDWKSIENANMATVEFKQQLIDTAVEIGTLTKTADGMYNTGKTVIDATHNFNDSLQDQWMTSDVLVETLSKYADETTDIGKKAYAAAQDVKTFSMMMDTLKEAAQSGWAETWEILVGDFEEAKTLWTDLSNMFGDLISSSASSRNNFLKSLLGGSGSKWSDLTSQIEKTGVSVSAFEEKFKEVARSHGIAIDDMIKEEGSLANVINRGKLKDLPGLIKETFKSFMEGGLELSGTTKQITTDFEHMQEVVRKVIKGDFGNGADRINAMAAAGENWAQAQALVDYIWERNGHTWDDCSLTLDEMTKIIGNLSVEELKSAGYTQEQIDAFKELAKQAQETGTPINELIENMSKPSGRELIINTFRNAIKGLISVINSIKGAWKDIFPPENAANGLYKIIETIHKFSEYLNINDEKANQLKRTFKGLFAIIDLVRRVVGGGLSIAFKVLKAVCSAFNIDILELIARVGDAIVKFRDWINEHDYLSKAIKFVADNISKAVTAVKDWISNNEKLSNAIKKVTYFVKKSSSAIKDMFSKIKGSDDANIMNGLLNGLKSGYQKVVGFIKPIATKLYNNGKSIMNGLLNGLKGNYQKVVEFIKNIAKKLIEAFKKVLGIHSPSTVFFNLGTFIIQGLVNSLKSKGFNKAADAIIELAKNLIARFKEFLGINSPSTVFITLGGFIIAGLVLGLTNSFPSVWEAIKELGSGFKESFDSFDFSVIGSNLTNGVNSILSNVTDSIKNFKFGNVLAAAFGIGAFALGFKTLDIVKNLSKPIGKIGDVIGSLKGLIDTFKKGLKQNMKAAAFKQYSDVFINMGKAIALIAASMWVISKIDTEGLKRASIVVGIISAVMIGLMIYMDLMNKRAQKTDIKDSAKTALDTGKLAGVLLALSASLLIISMAIKKMAKISADQMNVAISGLVAMVVGMGFLLVIFAAVSKYGDPSAIDKCGKTFLKISGAVLIMAIVAKIIGKMDPNALEQGIEAILAFTAVIIALMYFTKLINGSKNIEKIGSTLMKIAGAILIMGVTAKLIGTMDKESLDQGVDAVLKFAVVIAALMYATKLINGSKNVEKIGSTLMQVAGAILIMGITAKLIGGMDFASFAQGIVGVALLSGIVAILMNMVKKYGSDAPKIGLTLIAVAGAILVLSVAVVALGFLDTANMIKGLAAVGVLTLFMCALMKTAQYATGAVGTIKAITITLIALAAAVVIMSFIEPDRLIGATAAVAVIMGMLALVLAMSKNATGSIGVLITIAGIIAILGLVIHSLAKLPVESVLGSAAGLSILLLALTGVIFLLSKICKSSNMDEIILGVISLALLCVPLLAVVGILALMQGIENATQNAKILMTMITIMSLVLLPLTLAGAFASAALIGVLALTAMAVPLLTLVGILALMQGIENATQNSFLLIGMMSALTDMLVKVSLVAPLALIAVAAIAGLELVMIAFGALALAIGALMTKFPSLEEFLDKGLSVMIKLADGIGQMLGAFIAGFATQVMQILPPLGQALSEFMANAMIFIVGAKMVDDQVLAGVGILAASILALTAADLISGVTAFLTGQSFADLGLQLSQFMVSALPFIMGLKMLDKDSATAAKALADTIIILTAANLIDGISSWLTGDSSLADFAKELIPFGEGIAGFSKAVEGINPENVKAASEAGKALAEMAATIPNEGGVVGWFAGENSISKFGDEIATFGTNLKAFSDAVEGVKPENVKAASEAGKALAEMADTVPNEGGVVGWFAGENSLAKFGTDIETFGDSLKAFSDAVEGVKPENVKAGAEAGEALANMANNIPNTGGLVSLFTGDNNIANFGEDIAKFGSSLSEFSKNASGVKIASVNAAVNAAQKVLDLLKEMNEADIDVDDLTDIGEALVDFSEEIGNVSGDNISKSASSLKTAISELAEAIKGKKSEFEEAGKLLTSSLATGIKSKISDIKNTIYNSKLESVVTEIKKKISEFNTAGKDLGQGLINGINDKKKDVYDVAYALGQKAVQGEKDGQKSKSPSKLTYQSGIWFGEGLVNGIDRMSSAVYSEAKDLGTTATGGLSKAIAKISDVIDSDIDTQPTIRPVLDLSEVAAGAGRINGMFDMNPSVGVMANVRSISASMNSRQNEEIDVVSAIKDLGKQIGKNSGDTYTINGVTYDDGSNVSNAVKELVRAVRIEGRT